jgi:hypothetical protein
VRPAVILAFFLATIPLSAAPIRDLSRPDELVLTGGAAEVLSGNKVAFAGIEYRFTRRDPRIYPLFLMARATDSATYLGAALALEWKVSDAWRVTVSSGPGYYNRNRSPHDLGSSIEFLSNLEVSRALPHGRRIGLSFGHISNGSISDHNPGSEVLFLLYAIPLK